MRASRLFYVYFHQQPSDNILNAFRTMTDLFSFRLTHEPLRGWTPGAKASSGDPELYDALLDVRRHTGGFLAVHFADSARRCWGGLAPTLA